jgi:anthranilate/para-aminobenzoate synthase component II
MIVLIDNYDSFTYNLVQKLGEVSPGLEMKVATTRSPPTRSSCSTRRTRHSSRPAPRGRREQRRHQAPKLVLGVCGHHIGFNFAPEVVRAERLMHGKTDQIHHDGKSIYQRHAQPFTATLSQPDHQERHLAAGV